jgi:hypothetical protein
MKSGSNDGRRSRAANVGPTAYSRKKSGAFINHASSNSRTDPNVEAPTPSRARTRDDSESRSPPVCEYHNPEKFAGQAELGQGRSKTLDPWYDQVCVKM